MFFIHFVRACLGTKFILLTTVKNKVPGHKRKIECRIENLTEILENFE